MIFNKGPEWFSSLGTELSPGTKVFALGGKINNTGLVEVPMGTTLRDVVENIGGGVPNGKKFKAAQTGGPSGGCIPSTYYDIPIDFENLKSIGCMMGSGGLIVMDEDSCMGRHRKVLPRNLRLVSPAVSVHLAELELRECSKY